MNRKFLILLTFVVFLAWFFSLYYLRGYAESKLIESNLDYNVEYFRHEVGNQYFRVECQDFRLMFLDFLEGQKIANAGMKGAVFRVVTWVVLLFGATSILFWILGLYCHKVWAQSARSSSLRQGQN